MTGWRPPSLSPLDVSGPVAPPSRSTSTSSLPGSHELDADASFWDLHDEVKTLGKGSYGTVKLVRVRSTGHMVAVKAVSKDSHTPPEEGGVDEKNEAEVLVSYAVTVMAVKATGGGIPGSSFFNTGVSLNSGQRSFLQIRLLVNGLPYGQSSAHASPNFALAAVSDTLSGHAAVALGPGAHSVQLQWKKTGDGVSSWSSRPSDADGYLSGRTIVATARHRYLWHTHADSLARIEKEGSWAEVPGQTLKFVLQEATTLRFLYSMTVRSDQVDTLEAGECWV